MTDFTQRINKLFRSNNLLSQSIRGGSVLAVGSAIENLLRLIRNIILVRLLAPDTFGLMATVIASVSVIDALTQVGLRQSTIQNKSGRDYGFLNSVWWISSVRGLLLYILAFFASHYISAYFGKPNLDYILRVGFLVILLNGLISPRVHILEKELRFKQWVIVMQGAGVAGVTVAIISAFFLRNVWALLLGYIAEALLRVIMSFVLCPFKPNIRFDKKYSIEIMKFSQKLFGLPILMMLYAQTDIFVIGKVLSIQTLGFYVLVRSLTEMPNDFFSKIVLPIILPVFSSIQDDRDKLRNSFFSATQIIGILIIPFMAFTVLFSESILKIVYGEEYSRLAVPFCILIVTTIILMFSSIFVSMYFSIGLPNIHRTASIIRTIVFLILIYPATKIFGLNGAAFTALISILFLIFIQIICAHRVINFSIYDYLNNYIRGIKVSLFIIFPGIFLNIFVQYRGFGFMLIGIILCLIAWGYGILKMFLFDHDPVIQES
jgi:O-antigen/teichoic acid export membrane protein